MPSKNRSRASRAARKFIFSLSMTLFFVFLSLFEGLGYQILSLEEATFTANVDHQVGYDVAGMVFEAGYNPLLFPSNWLFGRGYVAGNFSTVYVGQGPGPHDLPMGEVPRIGRGAAGGAFSPRSYMPTPDIRREDFVLSMALRELPINFLLLLGVAVIIEILGHRLLHTIFLCGILGFFVAGVVGVIIGLVFGAIATLICMVKLPKNNIVTESWNALWK
ncbi:MAG: hypothetical protein JSW72_00070 [Candidatus Bathyarchaeota archaeon]|nr:MAG: hypothetical protein JSW72_00070 [Candidatus Bathyarchaeota archaeon]